MKELKEIRKKMGFSIVDASEITGLSQTFINRVEKGEKVSFEKAVKYAESFGCKIKIFQISSGWITTIEKGVTTYDFGNGTVIIRNDNCFSLIRSEYDTVREVYLYDETDINLLLLNTLQDVNNF